MTTSVTYDKMTYDKKPFWKQLFLFHFLTKKYKIIKLFRMNLNLIF